MKTKKQTTILFLAVSLLCVVGKTSEGKDSGRQDGKPNVLFIAIDDLNDWNGIVCTTGIADDETGWARIIQTLATRLRVKNVGEGAVVRHEVFQNQLAVQTHPLDRHTPCVLSYNRINLSIENRANNWHNEWAYWNKVKVVTE